MLRAGARYPDAACTAPGPSTTTATATPSSSDPQEMMPLEQIYATLNEYLQLEQKYQPRLCLPADCENGDVSTGTRDGAAHVLRCLKIWYDLPADVLITAVNLLDRFLTKMKVRGCHVPCITVACLNLALDRHALATRTTRTVSVDELVSISQSACTAGDVTRMSRVIADKLGLHADSACVTALEWLRLLRTLTLTVTQRDTVPSESELVTLLEIAVCDAACADARMSELALVLIFYKLEQQMVEWSKPDSGVDPLVMENAYYLFELGAQIQEHCRMSDASLVSTRNRVRHVISRYEMRCAAPQRQRLVWRLSSRTLRVLRPTDRLHSLLPTIQETHQHRPRSDSESSENEETSSWPRSPVVPVYCDN